MDASKFRQLMGLWPTGVAVVAGWDVRQNRLGFVVGSFCSVSLDPLLVSFCVQKSSSTWSELRRTARVSVNFLALHQQDLCTRFASGDPLRRFDGLPHEVSPRGLPRLGGCCGWLDACVREEIEAGDHWIVLAAVEAMEVGPSGTPLAFAKGRLGRVEPWQELGSDHLESWELSLNGMYTG